MRACVGGPMLGQNVTDGATDILVAAGHRKDNDGGGGGGARAARPNASITTCWLFIYILACMVGDGPHMACMLHQLVR